MKPSARFPWLSIHTDGRRKSYHAALILKAITALRAEGVTQINASHVRDGGFNKRIPLCYDGRRYDIAFIDDKDQIVMIEIMRTYRSLDDG